MLKKFCSSGTKQQSDADSVHHWISTLCSWWTPVSALSQAEHVVLRAPAAFPVTRSSHSFEKMFWGRQQCNATGDGYAWKADPTLPSNPHFNSPFPTVDLQADTSFMVERWEDHKQGLLLPSKQLPRFLPWLSPPRGKKEKNIVFFGGRWGGQTWPFLTWTI